MYVRTRMNMMFLYSIIISIVLRALKKQKKKQNSKILSPAAALFVCMLIPRTTAAAESSFPLFLRFTPQSFFSNKNKNSVTNHKKKMQNVFSFVLPPLLIVSILFRNESEDPSQTLQKVKRF